MDVLHTKKDKDILVSLLAEAAKATNELKCARQDVDKAGSRLNFILVLVNEMINRQGD